MESSPTSKSTRGHAPAVPPEEQWASLFADPKRARATLRDILLGAVADLGGTGGRLALSATAPDGPLTLVAVTTNHEVAAHPALDWIELQVIAAGGFIGIRGFGPLPSNFSSTSLLRAYAQVGAPMKQTGNLIGVISIGFSAEDTKNVIFNKAAASLNDLAGRLAKALPHRAALPPPPMHIDHHSRLFSQFPWATLIVKEGRIEHANTAAEFLLGRTVAELESCRFDDILVCEQDVHATTEPPLYVLRVDGTRIPVQRVDLPLIIGEHEQSLAVVLIDRMREQELIEERVKTAELAGIFRTIATVNHQINNPLFGLMASLQMLEEELKPTTASVQKKLDRMTECAERIRQSTEMLGRVVRPARQVYAGGEGMLDLSAATHEEQSASERTQT